MTLISNLVKIILKNVNNDNRVSLRSIIHELKNSSPEMLNKLFDQLRQLEAEGYLRREYCLIAGSYPAIYFNSKDDAKEYYKKLVEKNIVSPTVSFKEIVEIYFHLEPKFFDELLPSTNLLVDWKTYCKKGFYISVHKAFLNILSSKTKSGENFKKLVFHIARNWLSPSGFEVFLEHSLNHGKVDVYARLKNRYGLLTVYIFEVKYTSKPFLEERGQIKPLSQLKDYAERISKRYADKVYAILVTNSLIDYSIVKSFEPRRENIVFCLMELPHWYHFFYISIKKKYPPPSEILDELIIYNTDPTGMIINRSKEYLEKVYNDYLYKIKSLSFT